MKSKMSLAITSALITLPLLFLSSCNRDSDTPTCTLEDALGEDQCECELTSPVAPDAITPAWAEGSYLGLIPYGQHSHLRGIEGHRGFDYYSADSLEVRSPADGILVKIETAPATEVQFEDGAKTLTIKLECGLVARLQGVILESGVYIGNSLKSGQLVGHLAKQAVTTPKNSVAAKILSTTADLSGAPEGGDPAAVFAVHFDLEASTSETAARFVCPSLFMSAGSVDELNGLLGATKMAEKGDRKLEIQCTDKSTLEIDLVAENALCNPRLDQKTRSQIQKCLKLSSTREIW
jgi:hypothetical protein